MRWPWRNPCTGRPASVAEATRCACLIELDALKPGNVSVHSPGHDMSVEDFVASADAIAPLLADPALGVGERILAAVEATWARVACNTNLGIVLLCAPLAAAALDPQGESLSQALRRVLRGLDQRDAQLAFRAIRLAAPAGLGRSPVHDVQQTCPQVTLREAMCTAEGWDRIAWQYAHDYEDVFDFAVPRARVLNARWGSLEWAASGVYLGLLARFPDSHIERKYGTHLAGEVTARAAQLDSALIRRQRPEALSGPLREFDKELKRRGINPGTTADLTVAALLAAGLEDLLAYEAEVVSNRGTKPGFGFLTAIPRAT